MTYTRSARPASSYRRRVVFAFSGLRLTHPAARRELQARHSKRRVFVRYGVQFPPLPERNTAEHLRHTGFSVRRRPGLADFVIAGERARELESLSCFGDSFSSLLSDVLGMVVLCFYLPLIVTIGYKLKICAGH